MIFDKILRKTYVIYLIDVTDINATVNNKLYDLIKEKKCKLKLLVNKIDVLPSTVKLDAVKDYIRKLLQERDFELVSNL